MTWKAALDKSGAYSKFSAKSIAEFIAEHTAIAASYIARPAGEVCHFVYQILGASPIYEISELTGSDRVKKYLQNWSQNKR